MVLEFYYDLLSQPCRALYVFLKAGGVEFEPKTVELTKGEHHEPEFLKKNPYHKVPIIDHDGFMLSETVAIMRYVATKFDLAEHWYPRKDAVAQARVDEFLHWQHLCVRKPCIEVFLNVFRTKVGFGRFTKRPLEEEKLKTDKEEVARTVTHIADYFLRDKPFIGGDDVSAADLIGVMELGQLNVVGLETLYTCNDKVKAWVERVYAKCQPYSDEALQKINGMKEMYDNAKE